MNAIIFSLKAINALVEIVESSDRLSSATRSVIVSLMLSKLSLSFLFFFLR